MLAGLICMPFFGPLFRTPRRMVKFRASMAFILCGDYEGRMIAWGFGQWWDIDAIRHAMIERYGKNNVGELQKDGGGYFYFEHVADVDFVLIGKDIGVRYSDSNPLTERKGREEEARCHP